ncbi:MAG TPA: GNAT family N-acetyltransferase [Panacibacter sp.]|nr:GNAT family N-acetyltransferase [Panacibacter sp.]HNP45943.1 GNAT family N-acetyltransferase [Panacibacter sp.]
MSASTKILLETATTDQQFSDAAQLFREYAASLDIDLSFQGFEKELASLSQQYGKPTGALVLAYFDGVAIGCAGVRRMDDETAELKRMYVQPGFRGYKAGEQLLAMAIDLAKATGYKRLRLDTIPSMQPAIKLYHAYGFTEIPAYRFNPVEGAIYMEKLLA